MDLLDKVIQEWSYRTNKGYPDINDQQDMAIFESMFGFRLDKLIEQQDQTQQHNFDKLQYYKKYISDLVPSGMSVNLDGNTIVVDLSSVVQNKNQQQHNQHQAADSTLLERKYPLEYLNQTAREVATKLATELDLEQGEIMAHSKNRIIVYTDRSRNQVFKSLEDLGYEKDQITGSSAGGFRTPEGVEILHKPQTSTGDAGLGNEKIVANRIQEAIELQGGPINVKFIAKNNTITYNRVTAVKEKGRDSKDGKKADIHIINSEGANPISIKKDGSFRWSSASTSHREVFTKVLQLAKQGKIPQLTLVQDEENPKLLKMVNPSNNRPYGRVYIENAPELSIEDVAFGTDNAVVVQRSFEDEDFTIINNTLEIAATKIYKDQQDFSEKDRPVLQFERNASKATNRDPDSVIGRGITLRTVPAYLTKSGDRANNLALDYNKLR